MHKATRSSLCQDKWKHTHSLLSPVSARLPEEDFFLTQPVKHEKKADKFFHLGSCHGEEKDENIWPDLRLENKMQIKERVAARKQMQIF